MALTSDVAWQRSHMIWPSSICCLCFFWVGPLFKRCSQRCLPAITGAISLHALIQQKRKYLFLQLVNKHPWLQGLGLLFKISIWEPSAGAKRGGPYLAVSLQNWNWNQLSPGYMGKEETLNRKLETVNRPQEAQTRKCLPQVSKWRFTFKICTWDKVDKLFIAS